MDFEIWIRFFVHLLALMSLCFLLFYLRSHVNSRFDCNCNCDCNCCCNCDCNLDNSKHYIPVPVVIPVD